MHMGGARVTPSSQPFVPIGFAVLEMFEAEAFRLRVLTVHDVVKDFDAVMSSVDHCKTVWSGGTWLEGRTLEQNLIDLGWCQKEFRTRCTCSVALAGSTRRPSRQQLLPVARPARERGSVNSLSVHEYLVACPVAHGGLLLGNESSCSAVQLVAAVVRGLSEGSP